MRAHFKKLIEVIEVIEVSEVSEVIEVMQALLPAFASHIRNAKLKPWERRK